MMDELLSSPPPQQVLHDILDNPADRTKVTLFYANVTEGDVLLRDWLETQARQHADRLRVVHVIEKKEGKRISSVPYFFFARKSTIAPFTSYTGLITAGMISRHFPSSSGEDTTMIFVCGPPPFMKVLSLTYTHIYIFNEWAVHPPQPTCSSTPTPAGRQR